MPVFNMTLQLILPGEPLASLISASCSRAAELPRAGNMFCCMSIEIGKTAKVLRAVRTGISCFGGRGGRLGGMGIHRRDERSCSEGIGVSRGDYTVGGLRRSDEDGAMYIVLGRKGMIAIVVAIYAHSQPRIVVVIQAICARSRQMVIAVIEAICIVSRRGNVEVTVNVSEFTSFK